LFLNAYSEKKKKIFKRGIAGEEMKSLTWVRH